MNNIVESYLLFKSNTVCRYIDILATDIRIVSKIPKQLNKLIYKYYDLFVLSNKKIDYELLKNKTGLDEENDRLILFYLLIEFDMASKTEYKDTMLYEFYSFIVNSIIIFIELEKEKKISENISYDSLIQKILKKYIDYVDNEYVLLIDKLHVLLDKEYNDSFRKEIKFRDNLFSDVYDVYFSKIKRSNNYYLEKFRYKNDKLSSESKKDVELINDEFLFELNLINIEMMSMKILDDSFEKNDKKYFVRLDNIVILKKSNLMSFMNLIKLRFLKEKIIFLVNTDLLEKNEEKISYLIQNDYVISYFKNNALTAYDVYKNGGYLFVDISEDIKSCMKFAKNNNLEIVVYRGNKKDMDKLNNIMYVT